MANLVSNLFVKRQKIKNRFLVIGYFGHNNFGDELALQAYLRTVDQSAQVSILSFNADYDKIGLETYFWQKSRKANIIQFIKLALNHNNIVWVGGTCFTDSEGDGLFNYLILAKLFFLNFQYKAVGANKLKKFSRKMKFFLTVNLCSKITVRDSSSYICVQKYRLFNKMRFPVSIEDDLALRELKLIKQQYTNSKNVISDTQKIIPTLAIGWRGDDYEKEKEKIALESLFSWLDKNINRFQIVKIIVSDDKRDINISRQIQNRQKNKYNVKNSDLIFDLRELFNVFHSQVAL